MNKMLVLIIVVAIFFGCKSEKNTPFPPKKVQVKNFKLNFLDEYVFPPNYNFKNTIIGGLSGIDFVNNSYVLVADDANKPRFYKTDIRIKNKKIDIIIFKDVVQLDKDNSPFFETNFLDLESIVVSELGIVISSEGSINFDKSPVIFIVDSIGNFKKSFKLPKKFLANSPEKPRHNGVFEGLSRSYTKSGFWTAMEFPLTADGEEPKFPTSKSPVRFTYYDAKTLQPKKEFLYELSALSRATKGVVNLNGLTDVLEFKPNHFFVIERTYQSGYKGNENLIRIYEAIIEDDTTNTLEISSVKDEKYIPMKKRLVFDFSSIKSQLTNEIIDNIEGITLGPKLSNGNQSLILVADDNFQKFGKQLNQFVLFEIVE